jgi:hypothetical protein
MRLILPAFTFVTLSFSVLARDGYEEPAFICPFPRCTGKFPSEQRRSTPAVGFALEIGYGYGDCSNLHFTKVDTSI